MLAVLKRPSNQPPAKPEPTPPTIHELVARTKPLTDAVPDLILRAQSTGGGPTARDYHPCVNHGEPSSDPLWFCIQTAGNAEFRVLLELSRLRFQAYCPLSMRQRQARTGRPFQDVIEPFFPRYLFVRFDPRRDAWGRIQHVWGVRGFMRAANGMPIVVPDLDIFRIQTRKEVRHHDGVIDLRTVAEKQRSESRARREAAGARVPVQYLPAFAAGQEVRLKSGAFADLTGIVEASADDRITLFLEMFGRPTKLTVTGGEIEAVPPKEPPPDEAAQDPGPGGD